MSCYGPHGCEDGKNTTRYDLHSRADFKFLLWSGDVCAKLGSLTALDRNIDSKPLKRFRHLGGIGARNREAFQSATCGRVH